MINLHLFNGLISFLLFAGVYSLNSPAPVEICTSPIFCKGDILDTIQMAKLFDDSKTFVDMKLKYKPEVIIEKFNTWKEEHPGNVSRDEVRKFVKENFDEPGKEFEDYTPTDWKENPSFLANIKDADFKQWANDLNHLWLKLGRKMTDDVKVNHDQYSIIHVNNSVIVPGGRFREFYYWDSYWIVLGLLHSEMYTTVKGMLHNFMSIVELYGFIPNGGRVYYSGRSQPPLLGAMIKQYIDTTNDTSFMREAAEILEREFHYFQNNHMINVNGHALAVYSDMSEGPRPESYAEDKETAQAFNTNEEREEHWAELKAAAESGMDFSSRWFIKDGTNQGTLADLKCRSIVPVELNAFLYSNALIISEFYLKTGNKSKAAEFESKAHEIYTAVNAVLWHDDIGAWLDYDLLNKKRRNYFTPTNLAPLWVKCYNETEVASLSTKVLKYIKDLKLDSYPGGVPNTLEYTGEQWDYPNVWPPMQHMLIIGLDNLGSDDAKKLAFDWAAKWTRSNFVAYKSTRAMYEKYLATEMGGHGGGGEYNVQVGFGWTNGVILDLLAKYGDRLTTTDGTGRAESKSRWAFSGFTTAIIAVTAVITGGLIG